MARGFPSMFLLLVVVVDGLMVRTSHGSYFLLAEILVSISAPEGLTIWPHPRSFMLRDGASRRLVGLIDAAWPPISSTPLGVEAGLRPCWL